MTIKFGPDAPSIEKVQEENDHGRGWHIIAGGDIDPKAYDYTRYGSRHWVRFASETGTCNHGTYHDNGDYTPAKWECPHDNKHIWWADYFYHVNAKTSHFYDPEKPEDYGEWFLGAN
jgi:hypothetical protein